VKFARLGPVGWERPIIIEEDSAYDMSSLTPEIDGRFFETDGPRRAAAALANGDLRKVEMDSVRVGPPIARPGAVIGIGMNYAAHAAESGSPPPPQPVIFLKAPNTVAGPYDDVAIPPRSTKTDWEVELAVVIGTKALYLESPEESLAHIAGFVVANDISERAWQLEDSGGQWSKGKCAPGFNPLGPWLVTPNEVDHSDLRLRSWVNGEPRQDSTTADMIFDVPFLLWHLSQHLALEPGDVILTGTPEGVALSGRYPYLRAGDVIEFEIEGLGRQRQVVVSNPEGRTG
jgi:2,4-diketo-3-deoxy-L-fuconate hydrolase